MTLKSAEHMWRIKACNLLVDGFGVEDISIKLNVDTFEVRTLVSALRSSGKLLDLVGGRL